MAIRGEKLGGSILTDAGRFLGFGGGTRPGERGEDVGEEVEEEEEVGGEGGGGLFSPPMDLEPRV